MKKLIILIGVIVVVLGLYMIVNTNHSGSSIKVYENTIAYDENKDLYIGVNVSRDKHELMGYKGFTFTEPGKKTQFNKELSQTHEGEELYEISMYISQNPSAIFPKEEDLNLEYINYEKVKECWDGLGLPDDLKAFEKTMDYSKESLDENEKEEKISNSNAYYDEEV